MPYVPHLRRRSENRKISFLFLLSFLRCRHSRNLNAGVVRRPFYLWESEATTAPAFRPCQSFGFSLTVPVFLHFIFLSSLESENKKKLPLWEKGSGGDIFFILTDNCKFFPPEGRLRRAKIPLPTTALLIKRGAENQTRKKHTQIPNKSLGRSVASNSHVIPLFDFRGRLGGRVVIVMGIRETDRSSDCCFLTSCFRSIFDSRAQKSVPFLPWGHRPELG